jgi:hypothetical protein
MGISLTGLTPATTYDALIKVGDNGPIDATLKVLSDGLGTNLPMEASTTGINFTGNLTQSGTALQPVLVSGTNIKTINSTSILGSGNIAVVTSPSGVSGAIQFSNGSAFASDAANFFWDDTNNRLGIGTNAPTRQVELVGSVASPAYLALRYGTATGGGPTLALDAGAAGLNYLIISTTSSNGSVGANALGIYDGTDYRLVLKSGNLGIGEVAPTSRLHIKGSGSTSATTSLLVQNSSGFSAITVTDDLKVNINSLVFGGNNGYIGINNSPSIDSALRNVRTDAGTSPLSISTGEVGVGDTTTYASAIFAIGSTTRGFLPPRMTTTERNAIASPAAGLMIYNTTTAKLNVYTTAWEAITSL